LGIGVRILKSLGASGNVGAAQVGRDVPYSTCNDDGTLECWQQPELPAWEVPKRNPHERRPRAPAWDPEAAAEIAELAAASDDAAGGDIAA
jgi:hypothetical protein